MQISLTYLHALARRLRVRLIYFNVIENPIPYLERFYLGQRNGYTYYLHRYLGPDPDRDLHNHPWKFSHSRILHGGYIERRLEFGFQKRKIEYIPSNVINTVRGFYYYNAVSSKNTLGEYTWHSIVEIQEPETWTLFWHSDWFRSWGFLTDKGYQPSKEKTDSISRDHWWENPTCPRGKDVMWKQLS